MYNTPVEGGKKKVLFVTGTRADFGKLKPLIQQVKDSPNFEYDIFATGMHMLARYGSTVMEIQKAGFDHVFPHINQDASVTTQMDLVLANTVHGLGHYIREFPPDLIVVHGDRVEALAGAIVGSLSNTLVAHVEGGEVSGTVDEIIRHAVSKMSHIHFVANGEARRRLIQMGEAEESVYVIGSPDIDVMLAEGLPSIDVVKAKYEIPFEQYGILIYHPVTTELDVLRRNTEIIVRALEVSGRNFVVIYPNNDHGADVIFEVYERLKGNPRFRVIPSMRFEYFLSLLRETAVIVGNSSAGIREAPVYGVPSINVGSRQNNRFCYPSILNVPEAEGEILYALDNLPGRVSPSLHFGQGDSAQRFMDHLRDVRFWLTPRQKLFRDAPHWVEDVAGDGAAAQPN